MKFIECYETIEDYYSKTKSFKVNVNYVVYYKSLKGVFNPEVTAILKTVSGDCFYTKEEIDI